MTKTPCQLDPDAFDITPRGGPQTTAMRAALANKISHARTLCDGCHRLAACLDDLTTVADSTVSSSVMVWAGRTPKEELDRRKAERGTKSTTNQRKQP